MNKVLLFISRGRTLRFHNLFNEKLPDIVKRYAGEGFTGRLVAYLPGQLIEIDMIQGNIVAALAQNQRTGEMIRGDGVLRMLASFTDIRDGYVEVVELSPEKVRIDLEAAPGSEVSRQAIDELWRSWRGSVVEPTRRQELVQLAAAEKPASLGQGQDAAKVASDVTALLRIVLRADRQEKVEAPNIASLIQGFDVSEGRVVYAKCELPGGGVVNVVCLSTGCAAIKPDGESIDLSEGPVKCKVYYASWS